MQLYNPARSTISKSISSDKKICFFVLFYYFVQALNITIKTIIPMSEVLWQAMSRGLMVLLIILMLFTILPVIKRSFISFIMVECIFIVFYCLSYFQGNAEQTLLFDKAFQTICVCIPMGIYVYSVKDKNIFYRTILKGSYFLIPLFSLTYFMHVDLGGVYNMSVSYALALPTMIQINEYIKERKKLSLVFSCLGVIIILLYGARGPLVCIITMFLIRLWRSRKRTLKEISLSILALGALSLRFAYYNQIINAINIFLINHGIYSRNLYLIINNRFLSSSGRDMFFDYYWNLVLEKPMLGWGLVGGWIKAGSGPNNMLIEFFLAFGIIGGALISIYAIILVIRSFLFKEGILGELLLIYAAINIVMFFVSGNFLEKPNLFILVALYYSSNTKADCKFKTHRI